jgi:hypothetical protein
MTANTRRPGYKRASSQNLHCSSTSYRLVACQAMNVVISWAKVMRVQATAARVRADVCPPKAWVVRGGGMWRHSHRCSLRGIPSLPCQRRLLHPLRHQRSRLWRRLFAAQFWHGPVGRYFMPWPQGRCCFRVLGGHVGPWARGLPAVVIDAVAVFKNYVLSFKTCNPCINRVHGCHLAANNERPVSEKNIG